MDMKEAASVMRGILGLNYEPIAVKFYEKETESLGLSSRDGAIYPASLESNL